MGGSQVEIIEKRRTVPDLSAIDLTFRPLLEHMLQPDPDQRPKSMAAVAASAPILDNWRLISPNKDLPGRP